MAMEGYMWKMGEKSIRKSYKKRWFSLRGTEVVYMESPGSPKGRGTIELKRVLSIGRGDPSTHKNKQVAFCAEHVFEIKTPGRTFVLIPEREADLLQWIRWLASVVPETSFQGDLRPIAERATEGPSSSTAWAEPDTERARGASGASDASEENRSRLDDSVSHIAVGEGKTGGSGYFARPTQDAGVAKEDPRQVKALKSEIAGLTTEVKILQQELASMKRNASTDKPSGGGGWFGRGKSNSRMETQFKEKLLEDRDRRLSRASTKRGNNWDEDEEEEDFDEEAGEPEFLPGCAFCGGRCTCKVFFLIMVNIVVIATGVAIASAGGYAAANKAEFGAILTPLATYVLIGVGSLFAVAGALGSFAATRFFKRSGKCLLLIYMIVMIALTLAEAVGTTLLLVDVMGVKVPVQGGNEVNQQITDFFDTLYTNCCNATAAQRSSQTCVWIPPAVTEGCPDEAQHAFEEQITGLIRSDLAPVAGAAGGIVLIHALAAYFALSLACPCCACSRLCACCCGKKKGEDAGRDRSKSRSRSSSRAPSRKGSSRSRKSRGEDDWMDDFGE
jgi:hypothetical protein